MRSFSEVGLVEVESLRFELRVRMQNQNIRNRSMLTAAAEPRDMPAIVPEEMEGLCLVPSLAGAEVAGRPDAGAEELFVAATTDGVDVKVRTIVPVVLGTVDRGAVKVITDVTTVVVGEGVRSEVAVTVASCAVEPPVTEFV